MFARGESLEIEPRHRDIQFRQLANLKPSGGRQPPSGTQGEILLGTLGIPAVGEEEKSRLGTILTANGRNCLPTRE